MLPLGPTGHGNYSPYNCLSVFAGNPLLISLQRLVEDSLLEAAELNRAPFFAEQIVDVPAPPKVISKLMKRSKFARQT